MNAPVAFARIRSATISAAKPHHRSRGPCPRSAAAPADLRGTAFGVFNLVCGVALLVASALAGWLWEAVGPATTFYAGAAITAAALAVLVFRGADVGKLAASA